MADALDELLEPGERVVQRMQVALRHLLPRRSPQETLSLLAVLCVLQAYDLVAKTAAGLACIAGALILLCLPAVKAYFKDLGKEYALTNRRFLLMIELDRVETSEVKLAEIEIVELLDQVVRVTERGGKTGLLGHPARAVEIGNLLAHGAGVEMPDPPLRREIVAGWLVAATGLADGICQEWGCSNLTVK